MKTRSWLLVDRIVLRSIAASRRATLQDRIDAAAPNARSPSEPALTTARSSLTNRSRWSANRRRRHPGQRQGQSRSHRGRRRHAARLPRPRLRPQSLGRRRRRLRHRQQRDDREQRDRGFAARHLPEESRTTPRDRKPHRRQDDDSRSQTSSIEKGIGAERRELRHHPRRKPPRQRHPPVELRAQRDPRQRNQRSARRHLLLLHE